MIGTFSIATLLLLALAACGAVADWVVIAVQPANTARIRWLTKGLAPALLILAVVLHSVERPKPSWTITVATFTLCLCLLGDYLIMDSKRFVPGMVAFAAAHLVLIGAFLVDENWDIHDSDHSLLSGRIIAVVVLLVASALPGRKILGAAMKQKQGTTALIYLVVISAMVLAAGMHTPAPYGWIAFAGALAFYLSDAVLGWRTYKLRSGPGRGDLAVMIPYHVALGCLGAWALLS